MFLRDKTMGSGLAAWDPTASNRMTIRQELYLELYFDTGGIAEEHLGLGRAALVRFVESRGAG